MFKDNIKLKLIAGKGGHGAVAFFKGRSPNGGIGGNGGNIYLEGSSLTYDLNSINIDFTIKAENGAPGGDKNLTGKNGKDITIQVPLTTHVYDNQNNLVISINKHGQKELLLKGGRGGLGNYFYRTKGIENLHKSQEGDEGQSLDAVFQLELYSDILLIGFPNAGKSSLLNSITNAESKVAPYAFTTLNPQLGRLNGVTIMDLPGLIEGTFEGKGLGTNFVKHTKSAKSVLHLISGESEDVVSEYNRIREEIKNIDEELFNKPEVVVLTKTDLIKPDDIITKVKALQKLNPNVLTSSTYDLDALESIKSYILNQKF